MVEQKVEWLEILEVAGLVGLLAVMMVDLLVLKKDDRQGDEKAAWMVSPMVVSMAEKTVETTDQQAEKMVAYQVDLSVGQKAFGQVDLSAAQMVFGQVDLLAVQKDAQKVW